MKESEKQADKIKVKINGYEIDFSIYDNVMPYIENDITLIPIRAIAEGIQYACINDGMVVGAFVLNDNPQGDYSVGDWRRNIEQGEYLVIHTLASAPEIYHKGLGKMMVKYCIQKAKENGCKALRLDVVPTNIPARRLYESLVFQFAGEKDLSREIEDIPLFALYELNFA